MFNALTAAKFVVSGVVGIGAGKIVAGVIKNNIKPSSVIDKVTMVAGAWAISGIVAKASKKYTDESIDECYNFATEQINIFKTDAKLGRIQRNESTFEKEGLDPEDFVQDPITKKWSKITTVDETVSTS